jgi:hypothetical protein
MLFDLFMVQIIFPIKSKVDYLLCLKSIVIFLVPLFAIVHLFANLLLSTPVITTLMWFISTTVIGNMMLLEFIVMTIKVMWYEYAFIVEVMMFDQFDPQVLSQFYVL